ncbi:hypothetical protein DM867_00930 [Halosegnis rubeus]|uniref:Uncharacterized protein n=1 Tax=Halosegnis rubeus TaxID=2212850 RepID=A0A5N5UAU3_9EURY|nr:hypothetical protein [Halosegnis rubeus]KAB7515740.1 hypothetical protein DM867_00930 [Halosegnis rubeus]
MLVVATTDFELYHGLVGELDARNVTFTTVDPATDEVPECEVIITGSNDTVPDVAPIVRATADAPRRGVEEALAFLRADDGRTVVGIDPGDRPGIAVLVGDTVVAAFHVPLDRVAETITQELDGVDDPLIRVGDGSRLQSARIIDALEGYTVELVDETGTTPALGTGARGMDDVLAAVNIARIAGDETEARYIEPTAGEIQQVKRRSREQSDNGRTIDDSLARRVARGDLTLEAALAEHERDGT